MQIKTKRVYEPAAPEDGYRVLVDRLWPRGVRKEALYYGLWAKDIAPSPELRKWYHEDPGSRWPEFRRRYIAELRNSQDMVGFMRSIAGEKIVTLLYASKDTIQNQAIIIQDFLEDNLSDLKQ